MQQTTAPLYRAGPAVLAAVMANGMDVVAGAVQTVAAPEMAGSLAASVDEAALLNVAYLASKVLLFMFVPRLVDSFGLLAVLRLSVVGLLCASLALWQPWGGLPVAIFARAAQGAFGAGVGVAGMVLLLTALPPAQHAWAQAAYASTTMLGPNLGNALCGATSDALDWRAAMAWALPLGGVAWLALARVRTREMHADPWHAYAFGPSLSAAPVTAPLGLAAPLAWAFFAVAGQFIGARGTRYNWDDVDWMLPLCCATAFAVTFFVVSQIRLVRRGQKQRCLVDLSTFALGEFRFACITATASAYGAGASAMLLPIMMRQVFGWSATDVGQAHWPSAWACAAGLLLSATVTANKIFPPQRLLYLGLVLFAAALSALLVVTPQADAGYLQAVLQLRSFAFGLMSVPTAVVAFSRLQGHALCHAVGVYQAVRQLGSTLATASMTWRLAETQARFTDQFRGHLAPTDPVTLARLGVGASHLVHRGIAPLAAGRAGIADVFAAMHTQVAVLSYRACAQEVLLVFITWMVLALSLRTRVMAGTVKSPTS